MVRLASRPSPLPVRRAETETRRWRLIPNTGRISAHRRHVPGVHGQFEKHKRPIHGKSSHHHGRLQGIGAATAILAASQGYRICINYLSDHAAAERTCAQVRAQGAQAITVQADVSNEDEIIRLFARVDAELGRVTHLVNNAGTLAQACRVEEMSEFRMLKMMMSNVVGPILCSKHALLRMSPHHGGQGGSIVNVSSAAARLGSAGEYVDYAASKGALDTFTLGLS